MPDSLALLYTEDGLPLCWRHSPLRADCPRLAWDALLRARGLRESDDFFSPQLRNLPDPDGMRDLPQAADLLHQAILRGEAIHIFGDFDADGVNGAAILYLALRALGVRVTVSIPHRIDEGHGISSTALRQAARDGITLGITVDTGSSCLEACSLARSLGLRMIVTDHHLPGACLPEAEAVLNPARGDCGFADRLLCGSGVAFFLLMGLWRRLSPDRRACLDLRSLLDRVALATVADAMELRGVNRILVHHGLRRMNHEPSPGIRALIRACRLSEGLLNEEHIGFHLAPRINAAGRMQHGEEAFQLLVSTSDAEAKVLAERLDACNRERRKIERQVLREAEAVLQKSNVLAAYRSHWHAGVVGLVAGRLARRHGRPAAIGFSGENGTVRLSLRGVEGFHIADLLQACADCLDAFGGHAGAGGASLPQQHWDAFVRKFSQAVEAQQTQASRRRCLPIDGELHISALHHGLAKRLCRFAPTGRGNPPFLWLLRRVEVVHSRMLRGSVLRLRLHQQGHTAEAVMFSAARHWPRLQPGSVVSLLGMLEPDRWRGGESIQFVVHHLLQARES